MKQFGKILKFELKYYLKNKVFVGVTVFLVLLIAAVMFFPRITAMFEEDNTVDVGDVGNVEIGDEQNQDDLPVMLIKAEEAELAEMVRETFAAAFNGYNVQITDSAIDDVKSTITAGEAECAFVLTSPIEYIYYVNNLSMYDSNASMADEMLRHLYQTNALVQSGLTAEEAGDIMNIFVSGSVESLGKDQMENFFYTYIMIFALYMVILLYGQMVATNVATEKSSRAMEVLITSAKPTSMMFGKVIASCLAGLIQLVAVFGSALVFYNLNKSYWGGNMIIDSIFNIPTELFVYMLVFFILGFLIYAFMFGAVGSTASKLEKI